MKTPTPLQLEQLVEDCGFEDVSTSTAHSHRHQTTKLALGTACSWEGSVFRVQHCCCFEQTKAQTQTETFSVPPDTGEARSTGAGRPGPLGSHPCGGAMSGRGGCSSSAFELFHRIRRTEGHVSKEMKDV